MRPRLPRRRRRLHHPLTPGPRLLLLGAMLSMLTWRVVMPSGATPPPFFNPLIAIWGSTCMVGAMFHFSREVRRRTRAEAQRDALVASERAARGKAERASSLKDEFLATRSHALRTFPPDGLRLHIGMPHEDGYALMRRIRRMPTDCAAVPAISLTAHARSEDRARAIASGFQRHLAKPIDLPLLVSTVRELAHAARARRAAEALVP